MAALLRRGRLFLCPLKGKHAVQIADLYLDAFNTVLDWELPEEACAVAVAAQACFMAGVGPDQAGGQALND